MQAALEAQTTVLPAVGMIQNSLKKLVWKNVRSHIAGKEDQGVLVFLKYNVRNDNCGDGSFGYKAGI